MDSVKDGAAVRFLTHRTLTYFCPLRQTTRSSSRFAQGTFTSAMQPVSLRLTIATSGEVQYGGTPHHWYHATQRADVSFGRTPSMSGRTQH